VLDKNEYPYICLPFDFVYLKVILPQRFLAVGHFIHYNQETFPHGPQQPLVVNCPAVCYSDAITVILCYPFPIASNAKNIAISQKECMQMSLKEVPPTIWSHHRIEWGQQTYVMGIVNVTPDSFSGDGLKREAATEEELVHRAVEQAQHFVAEGATFIDVGGESTRPNGAETVTEDEELNRVISVIRALRAILPREVMISIDTYKAGVAAKALDAGADLINDTWGLRHDPAMASVASERNVPVILMANMRGYQKHEIVSDIVRFLAGSIDLAVAAGIAREHIIVDPGIGFGMTPEEDLAVQRRLGELRVLGRPILLGTSRKSHIGRILSGLPASERLEGTAATIAIGIAQGADIVRVHDVREMMRVVRMSDAIIRGTFVAS
jgi:dihydropteroate synthase